MILILTYYLKEEPTLIHLTSLSNIENFINFDDYMSNKDNMLKNDLDSLMLNILVDYYGNSCASEIVDNEEEYTNIFEDLFVYNYKVVE